MNDRVIIIIPARAASTRFPFKPAALVNGHTLLERVWRIARQAAVDARIIIATENSDILRLAESFGAECFLSSESCPTGSDRAHLVASQIDPNAEIVVSLQGDAVLTPPWIVTQVIDSITKDRSIQIATPAILLEGRAREDFIKSKKQGSSTGTCVVFNEKEEALYFSKGLIPYSRESKEYPIYRHIGLYAYRSEVLNLFSSLKQGTLETIEGLEQLRALENGIPIKIIPVDYRGRTHASIDNPEDITLVEDIIKKEGEICSW